MRTWGRLWLVNVEIILVIFFSAQDACRAFSKRLTELGVPHIFEEYNGDHRNRLWGETGRLYTEVLPWFSLLLAAEPQDTLTAQADTP